MEGTVRTFQKEARDAVPKHMKRVAEGIAAGFGAEAEFRWYPYLPSVMNDARFIQAAEQTAEDLGLQTVRAEQSPGGEDFALYQEKSPASSSGWEQTEQKNGTIPPSHSTKSAPGSG